MIIRKPGEPSKMTVYQKLCHNHIDASNINDYKQKSYGRFLRQSWFKDDKRFIRYGDDYLPRWKDSYSISVSKSVLFNGGAVWWDDIETQEMDYALYLRIGDPGSAENPINRFGFIDWWSEDKPITHCDYRVDMLEDTEDRFYGMALYEEIDAKEYPQLNQRMNLEEWHQNFELDQYQNNKLMCFLYEQFSDRKLVLWRWPIRPCSMNGWGLVDSHWIVETQFNAEFRYDWETRIDIAVDDWSIDSRITRKFFEWETARDFYQIMRHMNLMDFKALGQFEKLKSDRKEPGKRQRSDIYANGDTGLTWQAVGEVFNWICHICGEKIERRGGTHLNRRGATVDHLVPITKGGSHTWNNVNCAHWECNLKKSNRI